eukprot:scaffold22239_cov60-Phaeocystis_antarctica.AAC.3
MPRGASVSFTQTVTMSPTSTFPPSPSSSFSPSSSDSSPCTTTRASSLARGKTPFRKAATSAASVAAKPAARSSESRRAPAKFTSRHTESVVSVESLSAPPPSKPPPFAPPVPPLSPPLSQPASAAWMRAARSMVTCGACSAVGWPRERACVSCCVTCSTGHVPSSREPPANRPARPPAPRAGTVRWLRAAGTHATAVSAPVSRPAPAASIAASIAALATLAASALDAPSTTDDDFSPASTDASIAALAAADASAAAAAAVATNAAIAAAAAASAQDAPSKDASAACISTLSWPRAPPFTGSPCRERSARPSRREACTVSACSGGDGTLGSCGQQVHLLRPLRQPCPPLTLGVTQAQVEKERHEEHDDEEAGDEAVHVHRPRRQGEAEAGALVAIGMARSLASSTVKVVLSGWYLRASLRYAARTVACAHLTSPHCVSRREQPSTDASSSRAAYLSKARLESPSVAYGSNGGTTGGSAHASWTRSASVARSAAKSAFRHEAWRAQPLPARRCSFWTTGAAAEKPSVRHFAISVWADAAVRSFLSAQGRRTSVQSARAKGRESSSAPAIAGRAGDAWRTRARARVYR